MRYAFFDYDGSRTFSSVDDEEFLRSVARRVQVSIGFSRLNGCLDGYDVSGIAQETLIEDMGPDKARNLKSLFPNNFVLYVFGDFLILRWQWESGFDSSRPKDVDEFGWILARKSSDLYHVLTFNDLCYLIADQKGWNLIFEFKVNAIKQAIKDVREVAGTLLTPRDENPLTMVIKSPQPYRGAGMQIAGRIEDIRNSVCEDIL